MCYLVRQSQAEAERGGTTPSPSLHSPRPRWIAGIAAALIGGLAVAAFVGPPTTPPLMNAKEPTTLAPVASRTPAVPTTGVVEQSSTPVDDGVPTASDVVKAGIGDCHHGL
jgi:hypothetical protein